MRHMMLLVLLVSIGCSGTKPSPAPPPSTTEKDPLGPFKPFEPAEKPPRTVERLTERERHDLFDRTWHEVALAAEKATDKQFNFDSRKPGGTELPKGYKQFQSDTEKRLRAEFLNRHKLTSEEYYAIQAEGVEKKWISTLPAHYSD